jgi:LysM repeat protein
MALTLMSIARRCGRAAAAVTAIGGLAAAGSASFGASGGYVVRGGDTLSGIATRFGVSVDALRAANHLSDVNFVVVGEHLAIPGRGGPSAPASTGPLAPVFAPAPGPPSYPARLLAHRSRLALVPSFRHWAAVSGVPAGLLEAMTWEESGWQTKVVSSTGAVGIGQLEPSTVRFISLNLLGLAHSLDARNPDTNIRLSAAYLAWLLHKTGGSVANALGGYYQGLGSLKSHGPWSQTRGYVAVVGALWHQFRSG